MKFKYKKLRRKARERKRRRKNLIKQSKCSYCKAKSYLKPRHITFSKGCFKKLKGKNKRITILLSSGAAMDWGGPSCDALKQLIVEDTTYRTNTNSITVGKYIFDKLEAYFDVSKEVNFETFLSVLESMYDFIMDKTHEGKNPVYHSFNPLLYTFSSETGCLELSELKGSDNQTDDRQFYFELWKHYLKLVVDKIANYCNHISNEQYSAISQSFRDFVKYLEKRKYIIRIYTTNYDRLIPDIYKGYRTIFEGFKSKISSDGIESYMIDSDRIYYDRVCLNYYNLHGSVYWERFYSNLSYVFKLTPDNPLNYLEPYSAQSDNPGHQHIPTNIVAGYSKIQRTSTEPFNLFMHSFFMDCKESDIFLSVGYSYSDFHLNHLIAQTTTRQPKEIIHISYEKGDPEGENKVAVYKSKREYKTIEELCGNNEFKQYGSNWLKTTNAKIYIDGFKNFIENEEFKNI